MSDVSRYDGLQDQIRSVYGQTNADPKFINALDTRLKNKARSIYADSRRPFCRRPVWITTAIIVLALVIIFFTIGPEKVYAEMRRLLGYIPGVGVVDTSSSLRVLKEPVKVTRDGVSITVTSAVLTTDQTYVKYEIFGVPRSAYPDNESVSGCTEADSLVLPDGDKLERFNNFPAVPANVNKATLVIHCIAFTLPGTVPENWEFPLEFVDAPADMTVMPVQEITPTVTTPPEQSASIQPEETISPAAPLASVTVTQVIDTTDGYVLVVAFAPSESSWVQQSGAVTITDAGGKNVPYSIPLDIQNSLQGDGSVDLMAYKINASGLQFPITFHYHGVVISLPDADAQAVLTFDAGTDPQPGQEWQLDQPFELAGHTLTLVSVSADSRGGYSFKFKADRSVNVVGVAIEGYSPNGGGGGGGGGTTNGEFNVSLSYAKLPAGKLTLIISGLSVVSDPLEWTTTWSPEKVRTDIPPIPQLPDGVCADTNTIADWQKLPSSISGKALVYEPMENGDQWGLVLYNLDGSGKTLVAADANWGALTDDGSRVVYPVTGGFNVYDIASGKTSLFNEVNGYDLHWSPDGTEIAYTNSNAEGIYIYDTLKQTNRQISSAAYSAMIGWAPGGSEVHIAVMAAGGSAWQIEALNSVDGSLQSTFVIENGSNKWLDAVLSADGRWIAYRGRDNASVYLVRTDGSKMHLLFDAPSVGTSGLAWTSSGWLAASLAQYNATDQQVVMVDPDSCTGYVLDGLHGNLEGIWVK